MTSPPYLPPVPAARRNALFRLFSSIWFGVFLLAAILVYSSIFSALAPARWALEMTEMQAFRHWLFVALVALFVLTLLVTTVARTRWQALNFGAITAHLGLLLLTGGAALYFATKIEGDVPLESPAIVVRARLSETPTILARFRAAPEESWTSLTPIRRLPVQLQVLRVETDGVQPAAASLAVQLGDQTPSLVRVTPAPAGWQSIGEGLEVALFSPPPQQYFYDDEEPALYVRNPATGSELRKPVHGLPIYYDRYSAQDGILRDSAGAECPPVRGRPALSVFGLSIPTGWFERWRMPIDVDSDDLPFRVRITGYVPFVRDIRVENLPDGTPLAVPVLALRTERRPDLSPRAMSAIRLQLSGRDAQNAWTRTLWCPFSQYPDVDERPVAVPVPGFDLPWEVVYSRQRHDLDASVAARRLSVEYFPGLRGVRSWRSEILVARAGAVIPRTVETNGTATIGRWTLFQSGFAEDHWSYSILGVGNRAGIWPMSVGWVVVALGCLYAFYVKPVLLRRQRRLPNGATGATAVLLLLALAGCGKSAPLPPSTQAAQIDRQIDWAQFRLLAVQDGGRYKTLESFARESFYDLTGREHLPGLSPMASLMEWLFHRPAYADTPLIKIRSPGLTPRLVQQLGPDQRDRATRTNRLTPNELRDETVQHAIAEMEPKRMLRSAINKVRSAQAVAERLDDLLAVIPQPTGDAVHPWHTPRAVLANLGDDYLAQLGITRADLPAEAREPIAALSATSAAAISTKWALLRSAWLRGATGDLQTHLNALCGLLPALAEPGVYPARAQRTAEARYYTSGKFTYGWAVYFLALLVSIVALVTGWRTPWVVALALIVIGLVIHGYGVSLRWYILGRIPVANMFEAVVGAAAAGVAIALIVELFQKSRVLLVGASATGFTALLLGQFALPGSALNTIPGILDDVQLRLHTVTIITAYALIFLAAVVAAIYLVGYYAVALRRRSALPVALPAGPSPAAAVPLGVSPRRPILAGAAPGDEGPGLDLPTWLHHVDWSHLIILNMIFVLLFVGGVVLGAWWADYSWGRPWGWDPKEVFALNTWIIYAILLHLRFVVRKRGLWTAWLSLAGCAMMAFNWFFVNFFISSVHSYA